MEYGWLAGGVGCGGCGGHSFLWKHCVNRIKKSVLYATVSSQLADGIPVFQSIEENKSFLLKCNQIIKNYQINWDIVKKWHRKEYLRNQIIKGVNKPLMLWFQSFNFVRPAKTQISLGINLLALSWGGSNKYVYTKLVISSFLEYFWKAIYINI